MKTFVQNGCHTDWLLIIRNTKSYQIRHLMMIKCLHNQHSFLLNSFLLNNAISWHRSRSTLAQVKACCLMAPSHYLNQCWLIINEACWYLAEGNFMDYHTRPIVSRGCGSCLWIALGRFMFGNEYSYPIHALCDVTIPIQTAWRHNAGACCHNCSSLATALSAIPLPRRLPLNGMFHQDSATPWKKPQI